MKVTLNEAEIVESIRRHHEVDPKQSVTLSYFRPRKGAPEFTAEFADDNIVGVGAQGEMAGEPGA